MLLTYGHKVRVRKLDGNARTAAPGQWRAGEENPGLSPEVGYTIEGSIVNEPRIGACLTIARTKRNGVSALGWFSTSQVLGVTNEVERALIKTANSTYEVVPLK